MSDFGLSIAASGLNADTAELDTASNNLSNINTPGYAQEVVNLSPEAAAGPLEAGRGVTVASVSELTDAVYESANVAAEGVQGAANQTNQVMTSIEAVFPEPSSDGLSAQLSTFWSDLSTLAANPNQAGAQQTVAADASGLAEALNTTSTQLSQLSASLQSEVGTGSADSGTLAQANALLSQVAQLNQGIVAGDSAGQNVNALSDERRSAVDQLAGFLGISTSTAPGGALTINSGGVQLVSGNVARDPDVHRLGRHGEPRYRHLVRHRAAAQWIDRRRPHGGELDAARVPGPTLRGRQRSGRRPQHAAGQRHGGQRRSRFGHRRGLHRDGSAEHLRRPGFGLHLHAQRHVGRHHRRLVRVSRRPLAHRHGGGTGAEQLQRHRHGHARQRQRAGDGGTGGLDDRPRHALPIAHRHARHGGLQRGRAPRPPHRTWPPRPPATWPRSPA